MANVTSEVGWTINVLKFLGILVPLVHLYCDNQTALHITNNPVFHEHTKHIEIDRHFVRKRIASGDIKPRYTPSTEQLVDIFTKSLGQRQFHYLLGKLDILNPHAPT